VRVKPARPVILALLLVLAASLLAACGGDADKDAYVEGLARVKTHLDAASKASLESGQLTGNERGAKLDEAHDALIDAAMEAEALEPPSDAKAANDEFAKALRDYAELYGKLAALKANDPDEAELYGEAGAIAERLDKASRKLAKAGYKVSNDKKGDS
jgi:hypothetical protein